MQDATLRVAAPQVWPVDKHPLVRIISTKTQTKVLVDDYADASTYFPARADTCTSYDLSIIWNVFFTPALGELVVDFSGNSEKEMGTKERRYCPGTKRFN